MQLFRSSLWEYFKLPFRFHLFGSLFIILVIVIGTMAQISDRSRFANSEVREDVINRWGAPIHQAAPLVRYVPAASNFTTLKALPLSKQHIQVDAAMNYRKRGLVYYSGFDFDLKGSFQVTNTVGHEIDVVVVIPLLEEKNRMLLSELYLKVDGSPVDTSNSHEKTKLVWTSRLPIGESLAFEFGYQGRGLEEFKYSLDPALPAKDFALTMNIKGGANFDYPYGVAPATGADIEKDSSQLRWMYNSLESGIVVGAVLPTLEAYDDFIMTMVSRAIFPFCMFFAALVYLCTTRGVTLKFYETYLVSLAYGFFYVLLAYLAAFMNFYLAFLLVVVVIGLLLSGYLGHRMGRDCTKVVVGVYMAFLVVPSAAVLAEGYTGLIYCIEVLSAIITLMIITSKPAFTRFLNTLVPTTQEV